MADTTNEFDGHPVADAYREAMLDMAHTIDDYLNLGKPLGPSGRRGIGDRGFILIAFEFGNGPGTNNYMSNADRADVISTLKQMVDHLERLERHVQ